MRIHFDLERDGGQARVGQADRGRRAGADLIAARRQPAHSSRPGSAGDPQLDNAERLVQRVRNARADSDDRAVPQHAGRQRGGRIEQVTPPPERDEWSRTVQPGIAHDPQVRFARRRGDDRELASEGPSEVADRGVVVAVDDQVDGLAGTGDRGEQQSHQGLPTPGYRTSPPYRANARPASRRGQLELGAGVG